MKEFIEGELETIFQNLKIIEKSIRNDIDDLVEFSDVISGCFKKGNKVLIFGNGGSAADAQHFAAEMVGRFQKDRRGFPVIALSTDTSILTSVGNDFGFQDIFVRQVEALGKEGDVAFGISTSGNSENVLKALTKSKEMKLKTLALLGNQGGKIKDCVHKSIIFKGDLTPRIQEYHEICLHLISFLVEQNYLKENGR
jgi:D-sedoheptulose 7-phosphate isomerase